MGNLLVSPVTEKETHRGQTPDGELTYAVSSMQGWRVHMEDAHICQPTLCAEERMVLPASNSGAGTATAAAGNAADTATSTAATSSPTTADVPTGATTSTTMLSSPSKRDGNAESNSNSNTAEGGLVKKAKTNNVSDTSTTATSTGTGTGTCTGATQTNTTNTTTATTTATTKVTYRKIDLPNHSLFAVFDGHGGSFAAQYSGLNFVRVLSRQPSFVQYAHFVHEQTARELMEKDATTTATTTSSSTATTTTTTTTTTTPTTPNGNDETMTNHHQHNDTNHEHNNQHTNNNQNPAQQAQIHRKGLELLEQAFRDAFLDLDREIWRVVNHVKNNDCKLPSKSGHGVVRHQQQQHDDDNDNNDTNDEYNDNGEEEDDDYDYSRQDSGTTAVAVMFTPQYIICANAGDSRSIYSKQGNCTIPLSYDHKPDDEEEERRIVEAGGFVRVGRVDGDLAVSRGLGDFRFKEYDLYRSMGTTSVADMPYLLNRGNENGNHKRSRKRGGMSPGGGENGGGGDDYVEDAGMIYPDDQKVSPVPDIIVQKRDRENDEFVVIACDGIFDVQSNHECISMTAEIFQDGETDMGLLCEEMLDMCLEKGSKDNMTALVIKFPAQTICEGGGVMKRRKSREQSLQSLGSSEGP